MLSPTKGLCATMSVDLMKPFKCPYCLSKVKVEKDDGAGDYFIRCPLPLCNHTNWKSVGKGRSADDADTAIRKWNKMTCKIALKLLHKGKIDMARLCKAFGIYPKVSVTWDEPKGDTSGDADPLIKKTSDQIRQCDH